MTDPKPRHTAGTIFWFANAASKQVYLATRERGMVYVMGFARAGMQRAQPMFQVHRDGCDGGCRGCGSMRPLFEIVGEPDHNGHVKVEHPDAKRLIDCWNALAGLNPEAVGRLVEASKFVLKWMRGHFDNIDAEAEKGSPYDQLREALAALRRELT